MKVECIIPVWNTDIGQGETPTSSFLNVNKDLTKENVYFCSSIDQEEALTLAKGKYLMAYISNM